MKVADVPYPCQQLVLSVFLILATVEGVQWLSHCNFMCTSMQLMMLSSFFICLLTILMVSFMFPPIKLDYLSFPNGVVEVCMYCEFKPIAGCVNNRNCSFCTKPQGGEGVLLCFFQELYWFDFIFRWQSIWNWFFVYGMRFKGQDSFCPPGRFPVGPAPLTKKAICIAIPS